MLKLVELQLPFLLWWQGEKPSLSHFLSEDDDSNDGNHDLWFMIYDDDDVEKISSVEYFIPHICQAKAASPISPEWRWVQEAEERSSGTLSNAHLRDPSWSVIIIS